MDIVADERGVIGVWFGKLAVFLTVLAVLGFDLGSVTVNYFGLDSAANDVAAAATYSGGVVRRTAREIEEVAVVEAAERDAKVVSVEVSPDGSFVSILLKRKAKTLFLGRFKAFRDWVVATAEARATTQ